MGRWASWCTSLLLEKKSTLVVVVEAFRRVSDQPAGDQRLRDGPLVRSSPPPRVFLVLNVADWTDDLISTTPAKQKNNTVVSRRCYYNNKHTKTQTQTATTPDYIAPETSRLQ